MNGQSQPARTASSMNAGLRYVLFSDGSAGTRFRVANAPQQGLMFTVKVATPNG